MLFSFDFTVRTINHIGHRVKVHMGLQEAGWHKLSIDISLMIDLVSYLSDFRFDIIFNFCGRAQNRIVIL